MFIVLSFTIKGTKKRCRKKTDIVWFKSLAVKIIINEKFQEQLFVVPLLLQRPCNETPSSLNIAGRLSSYKRTENIHTKATVNLVLNINRKLFFFLTVT